ncbi:hypothetical protein GGD57_001641 [Rhizobium esperanzae]|uniref:Uncharacterized protein n=1 Tax=Rhizobium esperanzae TaxID=1967781 RepID=A0A7W6R1J1_9HYPH|nr:hypothetical protein [Rhizobium esperanzae]
MFHQEQWFAWLPVKVRTRSGQRWAWLENVMRECAHTAYGSGAWRYYALTK